MVWLCQSWQALLALCFGLSWSWLPNRQLIFAILLHVEKSTQWCGSISSCANVPGKELARKSCPKSSTMASAPKRRRRHRGGGGLVVGRGRNGSGSSRRYHMRKQREQRWKVPSLEEVRLYISEAVARLRGCQEGASATCSFHTV